MTSPFDPSDLRTTSSAPDPPDAPDAPDARPRISLLLPPRWSTRHDPLRGILVCARCPRSGREGHVPEMVLRAAAVPDADLDGWRRRALVELAEGLEDFALEDDDCFEIGGHVVRYHRFAHREGTPSFTPTDLLCEQWCWWWEGVGITLSCIVERDDYAAYCDLFEDVANSLEIQASQPLPT